jgi:hypothetical protein
MISVCARSPDLAEKSSCCRVRTPDRDRNSLDSSLPGRGPYRSVERLAALHQMVQGFVQNDMQDFPPPRSLSAIGRSPTKSGAGAFGGKTAATHPLF